MTRVFDRRIRDRFPIGSTDEAMGAELARNGFEREDWSSRIDQPYRATRTKFGVCRRDHGVFWPVDAAGRLTAIGGEAGATCS